MNILLVHLSYYLSGIIKIPVVWGMPYSLSIEPTCRCNLRCPECPAGSDKLIREVMDMDFEQFRAIIDELLPSTVYLMLYFQGEPFMNSYIFKFIHYASSKNIFTVTSTNGHFLDEVTATNILKSGLSRIIISLDGTNQEVYEKYRIGGKLDKVLNGIKKLVNLKKELRLNKPEIIIQFLVNRYNQHQLEEIKKMTKRIGADKLWIKTLQVYNPESSHLLPDDDRYSRYVIDEGGKLIVRGRMKNRCLRIWSTLVVTSDGEVVPCCFDKIPEYSLGNLKNSSVKKVWKGDKFTGFRRLVLKNRRGINICKNCTEGVKVYLY